MTQKRKYTHLVIPDCQVKDGVPLDHLKWAADKRPDVIVCIGDFADMPSLSSYDVGKKCYEGRSYLRDIEVTKDAMSMLLQPFRDVYKPRQVLTLGNHEQGRIDRAIQSDRKLEKLLSVNDFGYEHGGWSVIPFLQVTTINGIAYSHYFTSGVLDRPVTSARALLTKRHCSAVMGHVQRRDIAYDYTAQGKQITGLFAGTFYQHDEEYMSKQANKHWRGIWMLYDVCDGEFNECPIPLEYLKRKYG
jgi:hypothetical protein